MVGETDGMVRAQEVITPRGSQPVVRVDVWGALAATALAGIAYVVMLALKVLPSLNSSVVLLTLAPTFAIIAAILFYARARDERDDTLGWVAVGMVISALALLLQMIAFPTIVSGGGPLHTGRDGSAHLYFLFHWGLGLGVVLGLLRINRAWRPVVLIAGIAVTLAAALEVLPSPQMLTASQAFSFWTIDLEWVTAALLAVLTVLWARRSGREAPALYGWVAVALSLVVYEIALNAIAGRRYDPAWWASLSMRVAAFGVLAVAGMVSVLVQLRRHEQYAEAELDRRESELRLSLQARGQLLASAEALTRATTVADVGRAIVAAAASATDVPRVRVAEWHASTRELRVLAVHGVVDEDNFIQYTRITPDATQPSSFVQKEGRAAFTTTVEETRTKFADLLQMPGFEDTAAVATLPLRLGQDIVGVMTLTDDRPRDWPTSEREVLGGLANQGAQALQRARLFEREHETAEALQRGMLPQRLDAPPGVHLVARYLPGAKGLIVGGDWYDSILLPEGRVALVIGDVMGKGAQAAAIMGRTRHTIRAVALIDPDPAAVLSRLDDLAADLVPDGFITLLYAVVDPATGRVDMARAGHLPPLVCRANGEAGFVRAAGSPAVGMPSRSRPCATITLESGSTMVLFTDGLVERRTDGIDPSMRDLRETLRLHHAEADLDALVDRLLAVRGDAADYDDTCVLLLRLGEPVAALPQPDAAAVAAHG
jgi:serine phosphatase RsbU (regulator of sigma subunit)